MNALRGYFQPASKKTSKKVSPKKGSNVSKASAPVEMTSTPRESSTSTPRRSPLSSRPSSIFPQGDFRNAPRESILDIKADVMVNWLHQRQQEKIWTAGTPGEGVVLKKARDNFTCAPENLKTQSSFFNSVVTLNVKVRLTDSVFLHLLIVLATVCHDRKYTHYQNLPCSPHRKLCTSERWTTFASAALDGTPTTMPEASFRSFHR